MKGGVNMEKTKKSSFWPAAFIGLKLLLICAIIAGIVSFVYAVTDATYQSNIKQTKELAVGYIFTGEKDNALPFEALGEHDGVKVSAVFDGDALLGYCAEVKTPGFGGDVELMVGYLADGTICGVEVVSHSETPGLGSKSADAEYLKGYVGKVGALVADADVDMIAGASVTSKAVLGGVNRATEAVAAVLADPNNSYSKNELKAAALRLKKLFGE